MKTSHIIGELRNFMIQNNLDIIFVQETKIIHYKEEPTILISSLSDGTKLIHGTARPGKNNKGSPSGGLAAYISPANANNIVDIQFLANRFLYLKIAQQINSVSTVLHLYGVYAPTADPQHAEGRKLQYSIRHWGPPSTNTRPWICSS